MEYFLVVLLVLAGVALLLTEMFLIPGFGIAGVFGFGCLIGAVVLALKRRNKNDQCPFIKRTLGCRRDQ